MLVVCEQAFQYDWLTPGHILTKLNYRVAFSTFVVPDLLISTEIYLSIESGETLIISIESPFNEYDNLITQINIQNRKFIEFYSSSSRHTFSTKFSFCSIISSFHFQYLCKQLLLHAGDCTTCCARILI